MKILKVVVDKLPIGCEDCSFVGHSHPEGSAMCKIGRDTNFGFHDEWIEISKSKLNTMRPEWCRLEESEER